MMHNQNVYRVSSSGSWMFNSIARCAFRMFCIFCVGVCLAAASGAARGADATVIKVFILAGQSNMQGQGVVEMDHPKYYNGGKGNLVNSMKNPKNAHLYKHIRGKDGKWIVRDDVWVRYQIKSGLTAGPLSIGFTGYGGKSHIGPEFKFGHVVGDHFKQPVLLIKTAWGGKSLYKDFRPPSAVKAGGGEVGEYYKKMMAEVTEGLDHIGKDFPKLKGMKYEIAGFVWFQGWNDMFNKDGLANYEENLVHLINEVRKAWGKPSLPVVIALRPGCKILIGGW